MKKLILVFAAFAISAGAYAQIDSTTEKTIPLDRNKIQNQNQNLQHHSVDKANQDGVIMQNGKMMKVKDGQMTIMQEKDMTLSNGTKIMSDGTYVNKDGKKMTLKEGERMDMAGKMHPMKSERDKNMHLDPMKSDKDKSMYLEPDSTSKKR